MPSDAPCDRGPVALPSGDANGMPIVDSLTYATGNAVSGDGTTVSFRSAGSGPPLLLVHGTTADHSRWLRILPALARDFTVHAIDRRGRGGSGDAAEYALEREGEDVAAVVEAIGGEVNLLGHSYGALCALEAAMLTRRLRTLILYEPPLPGADALVPPQAIQRLEALIADGEREEALATFFREAVGLSDDQLAALRAQPAWAGRVRAAHTVVRESRVEQDYRLDLARLALMRTPTLLLLGGESRPAFHSATRRLHEALPNSELHVLEGQQHIAMDTAPEQFVAVVTEFVLRGR